ncbi:hypothetical protein PYW07_005968 [Mythimna separata]|uniref:Uncharacterized protein n=1 Tax=Mythimna separata TaxID=271217 RepID=A0AAD7YKX7_MYTSE|nr:hypothetical protein PYW07_005968 [Mythimna separata]
MLQKWKQIIRNWINCYFTESSQDERSVNIESLLNIISHLHENLNLDESKSSILEAHTVEEFVLEKYPEFKYENETVEASNEDEIYLVASLLLFFVCVNSKDVDIKSAMCSKLSGDDQETILKFTKSLLECSPITRREVQAAITEACGLEMASGHAKVAETPPALRSLHGEVRRLQAALDAERFDRNYLQEELARTNLRMDKLSKDKEQYKLEIVNLKAKISLCCGQEQDSRGAEAEAEASGKLLRQLQDAEERLVRTQEMLDDAAYERDTYKTKVEELRQERDKWASLSQQESGRAAQLCAELEHERRQAGALRELLQELRQHQRRNGLDASLLECDDPDTSLHSLQHNLSVCSEACANVVEVQLSEEKAKVDALKQQLERIQDDMNEMNQKYENEKHNLETILSERENEIFNLKHRINEEIEEKNHVKSYYDDEISKLNNEINELEQKIKDNNDHSRIIIDQKMQEIKTLQEEKFSLLQSLSNETTKLENIIAGLKSEIASEKQARVNMRDGYENQMMKLNEKVLNRNNELVELQNSVFEKGEMIETLQMDLRNEKEISNKYHINVCQLHEEKREVENKLHDKNEEMTAMQLSLEQNIASVLKEIEHFKLLVANLQGHCRSLEQNKSQLEVEIKSQTTRFEEVVKDAENLKNSYSEELEKLKIDLDEKNAISTGKDRTIESLEMSLKEAKDITAMLQADNEKLNVEISKLSIEIGLKNNDIEILNNTLKTTKKSLEDELSEKIATIECNNQELANVTTKKQALQSKVDLMLAEKAKQDLDLVEKSKKITQLQAECEKMAKTIDENKKAIRSLDQNMTKEKHKYAALEKSFDAEMTKLMGKLNETEKTIKELSSSSKKAIKTKDHHIQTLNREVENLQKALNIDKENMNVLHQEKEMLTQKLSEEISFKNKFEKEYQNQCLLLENTASQLNEEIASKNNEIITLKKELELAMKTIETKCKEIRTLGERLNKEDQLIRDIAHQKTVETKELQKKISHLQSLNCELEKEVKRENDCRKQAVEALQKENEQLHFAMEEDNSNHEVLVKEKDSIIDRLEGQLKVHTEQLESIRKDYENITLGWEIYKVDTKETIDAKEEQINKLTQEVDSLQQTLSDVKNERDVLNKKLEVITQEMKDTETKNRQELEKLVETIAHEEIKSAGILKEKEELQNQLIEEKAAKDNLQTEKNQLSEDMNVLVADKKELLNEKIELTQYLAEEKTVKKIFEEERNALASENASLERKLLQQVTMIESILEDKECLTQQLVEEKSVRELAEKEKENLLFEKQLIEQKITEVENKKEEMSKEIEQLMEKHSLLDKQYMKERTANEILEENLKEEQTANEVLLKENEIQIAYLNTEIESLQNELRNQNIVQEALVTEKNLLISEKEELLKTFSVEKSAHDEMETEKDKMITKLCELNETYSSKANNLQADLDKVTKNMNNLQMDIKHQEELNSQIMTTLNVGLENLLQRLKEKTISNEVLQKILQSDNVDSQATDKCDMLINIANTIFPEMEMRQNVEKALENTRISLEEQKSILKQRDAQLFELQTEIKRLQQIVNENKIELSKRTETFNTTLDNKVREMHAIQEENQSLTNDLNDVKLQLELKVHSLKEKLIDNENLTDKLKNTYECQIDNLNVMITKLTNYLKDKTVELDAVRKEKERVTQALEEKCQVIKALEEEIKNEVQNQQKLLKDFDSERQVLKNMITVTESVMEDQKVTLNNIISEHVRASEILQKENKTILEEFESEKKGFAAKLQDKENSLESLFKEMAEIRLEKEFLEKEIKAHKEASVKEINNFETKLQDKENSLESLSKEMAEIKLEKEKLEKETKSLKEYSIKEITNLEIKLQDKENSLESLSKEMAEIKLEKEKLEKEINLQKEESVKEINNFETKLKEKENSLESLSKEKAEIRLEKEKFEQEIEAQKEASIKEVKNLKAKIQEKENSLDSLFEEMAEIRVKKERFEKELKAQKEESVKEIKNLEAKIQAQESALDSVLDEIYGKGTRPKNENIVADIKKLKCELQTKVEELIKQQEENSSLSSTIQDNKNDMVSMENRIKELASTEIQLRTEIDALKKSLLQLTQSNKDLECTLKEKTENIKEMEEKAKLLTNLVKMAEQDKIILEEQKNSLILENKGTESNVHFLESNITKYGEEVAKLNIENINLVKTVEDNKKVISNLEQLLKDTQENNKKLCEELNNEKLNLVNKCAILQEYHDKAEIELEKRQKENMVIQKELDTLKCKVELCEEDSKAKDAIISRMTKEKDAIIASISKELLDAKTAKEKCENEIQEKMTTIQELKRNLDDINNEREALHILRKENEELIKVVGHRETFAAAQSLERISSQKQSHQAEKELRDLQHQVDNTSSDMSHTSTESLKTISDLEKIILDKNRSITTLQSDVTYLKTLLAESESKLLDVSKELELSRENCHQLSTQLKKIVHQKNEELADLKRQVSKMSVTENRATQIIKVSAKYQAIILKRIAEIKTNTVLKELTNFGNSNNYDTEVKRSLSAGTVTMEDLENFLETTDRHLRKCSEKQLALQKERDRLTEVNKIHETEILNLKKLLSEQTQSFKALSSAREAYLEKLSAVSTLQRTARRGILRLESSLGAAALAALERAHAAALQDVAEAALALERWHERAVRRALGPERRDAAAPDAALDVQLDELRSSLERLLQQVDAAPSERAPGDARDAVAEVRAEYEDKLDRMKSKMKQLYSEQIAVFKQKQRAETAALERELAGARAKLAESSRAYEEHIRGLTAELWSVGEKFLMKKDEAEWLRRKQRSGSLMSLQHVHSSGLVPFQEEPTRPSDSQSLRSLPVNNNATRREGRTMHMSDEEGEVFDNRWLKELSATPRRESVSRGPRESGAPGHRDSRPPGMRLSELQWRNSLCPPHLKSSYPAETQFTPAVDEEDIKFIGPAGAKAQRKEVGITAYKKPGPPTPSKQAGRLSATDSELRESLRVEAEPQPSRKTSTPSRIRALFRSNKNDTAEGTPRSRRLSNIFRKK